jgi:hypothetical protein
MISLINHIIKIVSLNNNISINLILSLKIIILYLFLMVKQKKDDQLIEYMMKFINTSEHFLPIFTHHKQVYENEKLFKALLYKLKTGVSYNNINDLNLGIKGGTLRYFHQKIIKHKFFELFYESYMGKYIDNVHTDLIKFYMDSTLIPNKLGNDDVTYNIQLKKHKSCKISLVIDEFGVPIDYETTNSNNHDSPILCEQIKKINKKYPKLCTNDKIFIGDAGYDSEKIRSALKKYNIGRLVCDRNKRNTKDKEKLEKNKCTQYEKMLLNSRSKIEHINNTIKQNKTINVRYQRYMSNYTNFVLFALIRLSFGKIGKI